MQFQQQQDDLVYCSICSRKYNETAYSKHLPMCERKQKLEKIKKPGTGGGIKKK